MFLQVCVCLRGGGCVCAIPACIAGGIPACLAAGGGGGCGYPSMPCWRGSGSGPQPRGKLRGIWSRPTPKGEVQGDLAGGVPAPGGACSWGCGDPPWRLQLRSVRILLECILVSYWNFTFLSYFLLLHSKTVQIMVLTLVNPFFLSAKFSTVSRNFTKEKTRTRRRRRT